MLSGSNDDDDDDEYVNIRAEPDDNVGSFKEIDHKSEYPKEKKYKFDLIKGCSLSQKVEGHHSAYNWSGERHECVHKFHSNQYFS